MEYAKIIITNLPSFYKINLYNAINKEIRILVIFTGDEAEIRNADFFKGKMEFEYIDLLKFKKNKIFEIKRILKESQYEELILGGWDSLSMWMAAFRFPKGKNAVIIESSYYESVTTGLKGIIKRIFMKRISKVYVSGKAQEKLARALNFKGEYITTKGVGIFNVVQQPPYQPRTEVKNFVYVGRLSPEKNLKFLISVFNQLPQYTLNIIGFGPLENCLKSIAKSNTIFHGAINNQDLPQYYQAFDVFVLPSKSEPWGMVIEEALNNGMPVLVSDRVGCVDEIISEGHNGLIFKYNEEKSLKKSIEKISDIDFYNQLRLNISNLDFFAIADSQIQCYL